MQTEAGGPPVVAVQWGRGEWAPQPITAGLGGLIYDRGHHHQYPLLIVKRETCITTSSIRGWAIFSLSKFIFALDIYGSFEVLLMYLGRRGGVLRLIRQNFFFLLFVSWGWLLYLILERRRKRISTQRNDTRSVELESDFLEALLAHGWEGIVNDRERKARAIELLREEMGRISGRCKFSFLDAWEKYGEEMLGLIVQHQLLPSATLALNFIDDVENLQGRALLDFVSKCGKWGINHLVILRYFLHTHSLPNVNRGWHPLFSQSKYQGMRLSGFSPLKTLSSRGHRAGWTPFVSALNTHNYSRASLCEKNYSVRLPRGTCLRSSSELVPLGYLTARRDSQTLQSSLPTLRRWRSESL